MTVIKLSVPQYFGTFSKCVPRLSDHRPHSCIRDQVPITNIQVEQSRPAGQLKPTGHTAIPHVDLELPNVMPEYCHDPGALDATRVHSLALAWYGTRGGQISHWHRGIKRTCVVACGREPPRPCTLRIAIVAFCFLHWSISSVGWSVRECRQARWTELDEVPEQVAQSGSADST
jgi:hypothetical protein